MEITVLETGFCDFLERYTRHAVHLAIFYEETLSSLIMADAAVRAILDEKEDVMFYGEIGYADTEWHIPSPEDDDMTVHEFLKENHVM